MCRTAFKSRPAHCLFGARLSEQQVGDVTDVQRQEQGSVGSVDALSAESVDGEQEHEGRCQLGHDYRCDGWRPEIQAEVQWHDGMAKVTTEYEKIVITLDENDGEVTNYEIEMR